MGAAKSTNGEISLADWQQDLALARTSPLLRGLLHSDGCRFINTGSYGWPCPATRSQLSDDIKHLLRPATASDLHWTVSFRQTSLVYVSRKADVARLDEFVGPKR